MVIAFPSPSLLFKKGGRGGCKTEKILCLDILVVTTSLHGGLSSGHTAGSATTEGGSSGELDGSLGVDSDEEGRHVHELLADADVSLSDEHSGVVDGLGEAGLVDDGLQSSVEQSLGGQLQDVIELLLVVAEEPVPDHSSEKGGAFEQTLGVVGVQGEELSGSLSDLGQSVLDSPDLSLASQAVLAAESELLVESLLLVGSSRGLVGLGVVSVLRALGHLQ